MGFDTSHLYAVIMAGGRGERFWPAGRRNRPKQMLSVTGRKTMIEETVLRLFPLIEPEKLLVITNAKFVDEIRELLPIPAENVIGEPVGRDTAPCVALATALVMQRDKAATMILLPADHVIRPAKVFQRTLLDAAEAAQSGSLVTIGISPTCPATGYGYIHCGRWDEKGFRKVIEFREKPNKETANVFFRDGSYLWNSGMFIWKADAIFQAFRRYAPSLAKKLEGWVNGKDYNLDFAECEKISIDYAVMEKASDVLVGSAPFYWNDIGSWSSLKTILPLDSSDNATRGNVISIDSKNNVFYCDDNTLVGAVDVNNLAVIKSGNGILVCPLSSEQRVKELVKKIEETKQEYI